MDELEPVALTLGPELTIVQAAETREQLLAWLAENPGPLSLDLGAVDEFDSAGVQLLLALQASLRERGQVLQLGRASQAVSAALRLYQLDSLLPGSEQP